MSTLNLQAGWRILSVTFLSILSACSPRATLRQNGELSLGEPLHTIAVIPFTNNTPNRELDSLGATVADIVSSEIASQKSAIPIERQRIYDLISEVKLSQTGIIDQDTVISLGKILGVNMMGFGSYVVVDKKIIISARIVRTETGEVVGGVTEKASGISKIDSLSLLVGRKIALLLATKDR